MGVKTDFPQTDPGKKYLAKGLATDELFQAWQYAVYTNAVAAAGKKVYDIPMYVNAALNYKNVAAWSVSERRSSPPFDGYLDGRCTGRSIFYLRIFTILISETYCDLYSRRNNPLFIPEIRSEPNNAAKVFLVVGHYKATSVSRHFPSNLLLHLLNNRWQKVMRSYNNSHR